MDFFSKLKGLDKYEYPSVIDLVISALIELVGLSFAAFEIAGFWKDRSSVQNIVVILAVVSLLIIANIFLIVKLTEYRRQILQRESFIKVAAKLDNPPCIVNEIHDIHEIKKNGTGIFTRYINLSKSPGVTKKVFWYEMTMGSTDRIQGRLLPKDFTARRVPDNKALARIWFDHEDSWHKYAIILDPVLDDLHTYTEINTWRKWRGIWHNVWSEGEDEGNITVMYPTKHLIYEIFLPAGYEFINVKIDKTLGPQKQHNHDPNGRAHILIEAYDLPPSDPKNPYHYSFGVTKKLRVGEVE